jgi:GT2 family glycosyltransferase
MAPQDTGPTATKPGLGAENFPEDVSAAVVAHNAIVTLPDCMRGLAETGCPQAGITVYDVASTDGTGGWLAEHYPGVNVVRLEENHGPNPARSLAVTQCGTPFVLLLDADVQLLPNTAVRLREAIGANERIAVATPVVLYADRPDTVQYSRTWIHFLAEASAEVDDKPLTQLADKTERVGLASGCAPMIRKETAVAVGLFEPRYFFGKTDGEFAYRVTIGGFDIVEPASAQVLHHHHKRGSMYFKHQLSNRWHFMLKDFQTRTLIAILPVLLIHEPVLFVLLVVMGKGGDYFRALGSLAGLLPALRRDRRAVKRTRRRHDWQVLRGDKLVVPAGIDSGGAIGALVKIYRACLSGYWCCARRLLSLVSRPLPDGDVQIMGPSLPFQHSGERDMTRSNVA